jgi:hypothetical protein
MKEFEFIKLIRLTSQKETNLFLINRPYYLIPFDFINFIENIVPQIDFRLNLLLYIVSQIDFRFILTYFVILFVGLFHI